MCSDPVVTNNVKIPGREESPKKILKRMLCIKGQDQKRRNFCDPSPSLLLAEPRIVTKKRSTGSIPVLPRLAGLAAFPAPQGDGCPGKQLYFLATKAVEPESAPRRAGSSALPDPGLCPGMLAAALAVVVATTGAAPLLQRGEAVTARVPLPKRVLSNKLQLYRSLVKSLKKAAKI